MLNGAPPLLSLNEILLPLPQSHPISKPSLSLFSMFRQLLDSRKTLVCSDKSTALLLLLGLLGQVFEFLRLRHATLRSCNEIAELDSSEDEGSPTQKVEAVSASFKVRRQSLEATLCRWKEIWDKLNSEDNGTRTPLVFENGTPFYMVRCFFLSRSQFQGYLQNDYQLVFSALSYSDNNSTWVNSPAPNSAGGRNYDDPKMLPEFSKFCRSFRTYINDGTWCGIPWMFPAIERSNTVTSST